MGRRLPSGTKENPKGQTRSYQYRQKLLRAAVILASALLTMWLFFPNRTRRKAHGERVGTLSNNPVRGIEYGVQSTPLVMIQSKLDDDVLQRFLEEDLYSCREEELDSFPGLDNRVNPPVYVYEGYYHSLSTEKTIYSRNPNPLIGKDFDKPAAGSFTRAFYDAFRHVNHEIFDELERRLLDASSYPKTGEEDACYILAKWIAEAYHFGDLSVQIHYGKGNEDKLTSGRAWHTDAENSLLHLAVTLRGTRVLHSKRIRPEHHGRNSTVLRPPVDGKVGTQQQTMEEVLEEQTPGSVYLSSSTLMRHAPRFFDTDYASRAIALHARFLYTSAEIDRFRRARTKDSWERMTAVLANTLAAANLRMPSLAQVESHLALLSQW